MRERVLPVRKKLIGLAFALILALTTYAPALAHDCIIASRSDAGAVAAGTHSKMWYYFGDLTWLFTNINLFLADPGGPVPPALSPTQVTWAVAQAKAAGVPNSLTVFTNNNVGGGAGVLLANTPVDGTALMSNGKGVDHIEDYFLTLVSIYQQALTK